MNDEQIRTLVQTVVDGETDAAIKTAEEFVHANGDIDLALKKLTEGMKGVGDRFEQLEIFLPEMMASADAMKAIMKIFLPKLKESTGVDRSKGRIVIGTVAGDQHEIGKDIVSVMLEIFGFTVYNIGTDVDALEFIKRAEEVGADGIAMSSLMTTTMAGQREVIEIMKEKGVRDKYFAIVGGAPVTPEWAEEIGADGYSNTAAGAVKLVVKLVKERRTR